MSSLGLPADAQPSDDFVTIPDVPISSENNIINPNQVRSGMTRGIQQLGSDKVYSDGGNNQIIVADTVPRVLMGSQPTFGEGFYVSQAGTDATTNTDPTKWIFNSNQNVFKIIQSDTITMPAVPATAGPFWVQNSVYVVTHSLGFKPAILAYANSAAGNLQPFVPGTTIFEYNPAGAVATINAMYTNDITIRNTTITFERDYFDGGGNSYNAFSLKYYLLQETASAS